MVSRGRPSRREFVGDTLYQSSFVLRLPGRRPGPTSRYWLDEDVAPANPEDWQVPPFAGVIEDGYVWGRGAIDIKNLVAANAVAVRRLAAAGSSFAGTVIYAWTANEEGSQEEGVLDGVRWLIENRPQLLRCDYLLNEGDGAVIPRGERSIFTVESGEKGVARFLVDSVRGKAGHGALPLRRGNAILAAARAVEALLSHELPVVVDEASEDLVRVLVDDAGLRARLRHPASVRAALAELVESDIEAADMLEPLYGFSFSTTMVACNSTAVNVFPPRVVLGVDCRPLAGQDASDVEAEVHSALAGVDATWDFELISVVPGNASPYPSPLSAAITTVLRRRVPAAEVANSHCIGFTDAHWFRAAFPGVISLQNHPQSARATPMWSPGARRQRWTLIQDLGYQVLFAEGVALELLK